MNYGLVIRAHVPKHVSSSSLCPNVGGLASPGSLQDLFVVREDDIGAS